MKALCPACKKTLALKTSGRFRLHGDGGSGLYCPGSYMTAEAVAEAQPAAKATSSGPACQGQEA